jgi:hypothetical protein
MSTAMGRGLKMQANVKYRRFNRVGEILPGARNDCAVMEHDGALHFHRARVRRRIPPGTYYLNVYGNFENGDMLLANFPMWYADPRWKPDADDYREMQKGVASLLAGQPVTRRKILDLYETLLGYRLLSSDHYHYFPLENYHPGFASFSQQIDQLVGHWQQPGYKLSRTALLVGPSGIGKTRFLESICQRLIDEHDAVVLRRSDYLHLDILVNKGFKILSEVSPGQPKVILLDNNDHDITYLLSDQFKRVQGAMQQHGHILILAASNNEKLLKKNKDIVQDPARFEILASANPRQFSKQYVPDFYQFITGSHIDDAWKSTILAKKNLTPDYLREIFISTMIAGNNLAEGIRFWEQRTTDVRDMQNYVSM